MFTANPHRGACRTHKPCPSLDRWLPSQCRQGDEHKPHLSAQRDTDLILQLLLGKTHSGGKKQKSKNVVLPNYLMQQVARLPDHFHIPASWQFDLQTHINVLLISINRMLDRLTLSWRDGSTFTYTQVAEKIHEAWILWTNSRDRWTSDSVE